ncbi:MAG: 5-carboxymethyl-2-hydroxymuconate isomerase [Phycisphaera sp.]|nr:5-carboxymethyl-2-hydroxymuconate isomerase [Phycisphaera sp.]
MRIIRFIDEHDLTRYGHAYDAEAGTALGITGNVLCGFEATDQQFSVRRLLCPVDPRAILCIGLNYRAHAEETGAAIPERPVLFMKNPAAANHPGAPIVMPPSCMDPMQVDWEVELAVIIGPEPIKDVSVDAALDGVLGYTVANDVSARWWQKKGSGGQWIRGKSFDGFCPMGPVMVTPDELGDPQTLRLTTYVNGELMQDSTTADQIFSVAELISFLSQDTTLLPGTVLCTGTPSGVGAGRDPQVFLKPGDTVTVAIDRIGAITNEIVAKQ